MTRPRQSDANYWSNQHHALLRFCAAKVLSRHGPGRGTMVEVDDLVNHGWMRTLRLRDENHLHGCGTFTIFHMRNFFYYTILGLSRWKIEKYGVPSVVSFEDPSFQYDNDDPMLDVVDEQQNPLQICIEREENELARTSSCS